MTSSNLSVGTVGKILQQSWKLWDQIQLDHGYILSEV